MIAEPAFLSEYTIFALDHSKRPKVAQMACANAGKATTASPKPRGNVNGDESSLTQRPEPQSLTQKLQLKVPSMESLFRSPGRGEGLFHSASRENLTRSSSRDSLMRLVENEPPDTPAYDPPSDIESEAEETPSSVEALSKEQLLHRLQRVERSLANYRGKYSELVTAYRTVQRDKEKTQAILSQSQDKALRRIGELREELQMDQQAKKHLQEEFDAALEEKDQLITVLHTQVALMKKRLQGIPEGGALPEADSVQPVDAQGMESAPQSPTKDMNSHMSGQSQAEGGNDPAKVLEALQQRVRRQESLLQRCKELLHTHKERSAQLGSENETLQEQLQERLQELEKMKELHTTEKTRLITQLRDAKNLIEQLEQDKGMVIAETKRQMHETLEMKEEEIAQLRSRIQQATVQRDELQEQKEKSEKAAFEELERALGVAQRAEEARRQLQAKMEEQVKQVEQASEEERRNLQQELSRVKQEVVNIMKKSSDEQMVEMESRHAEALASKEQKLNMRLQERESQLQEQISQAMEQCRKEMTQAMQEKEQQAALALEEMELQKTAMMVEQQNQAQELQQELETARTKILELESSQVERSGEGAAQSNKLVDQMEEERRKLQEEIFALKERHRQQVEALNQDHHAAMQQLQETHQTELDAALKEKELQFQAHIGYINSKTLEKLDVKQMELEALSTELLEVLTSRTLLEQQLVASKQEYETRLQKERLQYQEEMEGIKSEHEQSLGGVEKTLKEELNKLKMVLEEKDKALEEQLAKDQGLKEEMAGALQEWKLRVEQLTVSHGKEIEDWQEQSQVMKEAERRQAVELEELRQSLQMAQSEKDTLMEARKQLDEAKGELTRCRSHVKDLERQLEETVNSWTEKAKSLQQTLSDEQHKLQHQVEQTKKELFEQERYFSEILEKRQQEEERLRSRLEEERTASRQNLERVKQELDDKVKGQETKMDKIKQKVKEMQEKFKKRLQEQEDKLKEELEKKERELSLKDQQVKDKILEMAQASSAGIKDAVSQMEATHQEQLERLQHTGKKEQEELVQRWKKKLAHQQEEIQEKHNAMMQEKAREVLELTQQLEAIREEKEQVLKEIKNLREELVMRETTVQKLQAELREAASKLESLSEGETMLKAQVETMEKNLNQALNDRNALQDQISKANEENGGKVMALSKELKDTQEKLHVLEVSSCKEGEDLHKRLELSVLQMQAKEEAFRNQINMISEQLVRQCSEIQIKMEGSTDDLYQKVDGRVIALKDRVVCSQKRVAQLKNLILTRTDRIHTLEEWLQQKTEENSSLKSLLEQMTFQENANTELIKVLTTEKESLQRDGKRNSQTLSEKDLCIEQLRKDNNTFSDHLKENALHISSLEGAINDLKTQLASSLAEKEEAVSRLDQQHREEQQKLVHQNEELSKTVEKLSEERTSALEQAEQFKNKLSEMKKKAEAKITQNQSTIKALETKLEEAEAQLVQRDKRLEALVARMDSHPARESEADHALSEKEQSLLVLTVELATCTSRLAELEEILAARSRECERLNADLQHQAQAWEDERRDLAERLHQAQVQSSQDGSLVQETQEKLQSIVEETQAAHQDLKQQREDFERVKAEILRDKNEALKAADERISLESAGKLAELKKKAEHKIGLVRKQLTAQIEEKEQCLKALELQLEETRQSLNVKDQCITALKEQVESLQGMVSSRKDEVEKQMEKVRNDSRLESESSLQLRETYEDKLCALRLEVTSQEEMIQAIQEREKEKNSTQEEARAQLEEVLEKLKQTEEEKANYQNEINRLNADLLKQTSRVQHQEEMAGPCVDLQGQTRAKENKDEQQCLENLQKNMGEEELAKKSLKEIEACLTAEQEKLNRERDSLVEEYEQKLMEMGRRLEKSESLLRVYEEGLPEKLTADAQGLLTEMRTQQKELCSKLSETEKEKQKLRKEFNSLQKELRALRKEHEQELEYLKKEIAKENEKKLKLELEDAEMKHNSGLKQLMREFNTQMANKEQELEAAVKEAVGKAQEVELELMESHREEASQLHKMIAQKEADLHRTVQRYEEILQSREEEMGARVWELQKELDELQQRMQNSPQGCLADLQAQLAQKTTLLSEAKLKEQEFQERIHGLEDKLRCVHKNSVVTHLGATYRDASHFGADAFPEPTEFEYLRKVMFEYMMGRETKTMAKVITSMLKFPPEQTQKILEKEDSRTLTWLR
ncbi:golgin subfamily A member 4 isoform X1 [Megalops cyprinoides]|uniref:golgin subfamily A member 4 isoform X1 n=1 Tax=Megalops cyprinoides TaxID=118141 RepID=UPI001864BE09|nr:golgin subfamily A member 4 isoform X1 [Megalops cyprinoides]